LDLSDDTNNFLVGMVVGSPLIIRRIGLGVRTALARLVTIPTAQLKADQVDDSLDR